MLVCLCLALQTAALCHTVSSFAVNACSAVWLGVTGNYTDPVTLLSASFSVLTLLSGLCTFVHRKCEVQSY